MVINEKALVTQMKNAYNSYGYTVAVEDAVPVVMQKTNLTYDGCRVWQAESVRDIFLIDPRYAAMIDKTKDVHKVGEGIYAEDDDSKLWILRVAKESDKTYLEHMEKISWVKE